MSLLAEETLAAERLAHRRNCFPQVGLRTADVCLRVTGAIIDCEPA